MSIAQELAKRIHAIQFEDLPVEVVPLARTAMLDAVGTSVSISKLPLVSPEAAALPAESV